jgi:hypothetical protein
MNKIFKKSKTTGSLDILWWPLKFNPVLKQEWRNDGKEWFSMKYLKNITNTEIRDSVWNLLCHRIEFFDKIGEDGKNRKTIVFATKTNNSDFADNLYRVYPEDVPDYIGIDFENWWRVKEAKEYINSEKQIWFSLFEGRNYNDWIQISRVRKQLLMDDIATIIDWFFKKAFYDININVVDRQKYMSILFWEWSDRTFQNIYWLWNIPQWWTAVWYFLNAIFWDISLVYAVGVNNHFWVKDIIIEDSTDNKVNRNVYYLCYNPNTNSGKKEWSLKSIKKEGNWNVYVNHQSVENEVFPNVFIEKHLLSMSSRIQKRSWELAQSIVMAPTNSIRWKISSQVKLKTIESIVYNRNNNIDESDYMILAVIEKTLWLKNVMNGSERNLLQWLLKSEWFTKILERSWQKQKFIFSDWSNISVTVKTQGENNLPFFPELKNLLKILDK